SGPTRLADVYLKHGPLTWSGDASKLLFLSGTSAYTVNADGTGLAPVPAWPTTFWPTSWSPDGTRVLAYDTQGTNSAPPYHLYVMSPAGSSRTPLANSGKHSG